MQILLTPPEIHKTTRIDKMLFSHVFISWLLTGILVLSSAICGYGVCDITVWEMEKFGEVTAVGCPRNGSSERD